ncbi:MAG: Na/Pi cotransporter family protein [Anaerolineae bacterium]
MELTDNAVTVEFGAIIIQLFGGLALFLYGMEQMTDAMKIVAGNRMKSLLAKLTTNRFKGVFVGTVVTAIIQSSSVTTVLLVGFISAGLMTLRQSIGVMLGAGIGTTITAQIVAFKVTHYALVLVAIGFLIFFLARRQTVRQYGLMTLGLGLIFFGMNLMSDATKPLRSYDPFIELMRQMENPLYGILVGTMFTAVVQSSSATMGVVIALASQGFLTLEAGIALAFGANIGTTVTALLASIGQPRDAVRAAVLHTLFRFTGVLIWLPFISQLAAVVRLISPSYPELSGLAQLSAEAPRQIANAHTLFNVANMLIFIWFVDPLARFMEWLIPPKAEAEPGVIRPRYLSDNLLTTPPLALDRVRMELGRLGEFSSKMVCQSLETVCNGKEADLSALAKMDDNVDALYGAVVTYLGKLSQQNLLRAESAQLSDYMTVANHLENIGDMIETNLVEAGSERLKNNVHMSEATREILAALHQRVCWSVTSAVEAVTTQNFVLAEEVLAAKLEINRLANDAEEHLAHRLIADEPNRLATFRIETEIIEYLKRVYYFAKRIAKVVTSDLHNVAPPVASMQMAEPEQYLN